MKYEGEVIDDEVEVKKKGKMSGVAKAFLGIGITLAIIIIAAGAVFGYFWNTTPRKLGLAEIELMNGETFETLGIADLKIKEIVKQFKEITNADTSNIVKNAPNEETDKPKAEANTDNVTTDGFEKEDGTKDYTVILEKELVYDKVYRIEYSDTTLCYVFNEILTGSLDNIEVDGIDFLKEINATINEVTIDGTGAGANLRIVISIDVEPLKEKLKETLGSAYSLLENQIPKTMYAVSTFTIGDDTETEGKLKLTSVDFKINETENAITNALFKIVASEAGADTEKTEDEQKAYINDMIGDAFETVVYNLGKVGDANKLVGDTTEVASDATITYGSVGVQTHKLIVITRKSA